MSKTKEKVETMRQKYDQSKKERTTKDNKMQCSQLSQSFDASRTNLFKDVIKSKEKSKLIKNQIHNLYGRHYPFTSNSGFMVKEQWQNKSLQFEQNYYDELIQFQTILALIYTIIILISYLGILWYISTYRLLQLLYDPQTQGILGGSILVVLVDGGMKFYFKYILQKEEIEHFNMLKDFKMEFYFLGYFLLNILLIQNKTTQSGVQLYYILDFVTFLVCYNRLHHLWQYLKIITCTTNFKTQFKFLDLFGTLLFLAHLFALLLYTASFYNTEKSWTSHVSMIDNSLGNLDRYYCSIYFAFTTMLTIGYGDISPMNKVQIAAVLIVQVVGVATFSYIISEIGFTMSLLRKQEEQIEQSLSTLLKMSKFYGIEQDLTDFAKTHLISNKKSIEMIYPEDQNKVLLQLNQDLRQTIIFENGMSVIKSSIFFLCHWTKYFQVQVSKKIIKKVLHPNQTITQLPGKQKLYIIKSGKLQVYTNCNSHYKQHFKKLLKTITPEPNIVCDNVYGYTSIICPRPVKLTAISKDFTIVFVLSKEHFLNCVHGNKYDQQYYYEIRDRIEESKCQEGWQAPSVLNIQEHYRPSQIFIIKRHKSNMNRFKNGRKYKHRHDRMNGRLVVEDPIALKILGALPKRTLVLMQTISENNIKSGELELQHDKDEIFMSMFEGVKEYFKYFKKGNISNVLLNMQQKYFMRQFKDNRANFSPFFNQMSLQLNQQAWSLQ